MEPDGRPETADAHAPNAFGGVVFRRGVVSRDALLGHAGTAGRVTAEESSGSERTVTEYLVAEAPELATAIATCVLVGVASVLFLTTGNASVQLASDPEYRGRVTALWSMAPVGSTPVGSLVVGAPSDAASPRYAFALGAVACLAAVIIGRWPTRRAIVRQPNGDS